MVSVTLRARRRLLTGLLPILLVAGCAVAPPPPAVPPAPVAVLKVVDWSALPAWAGTDAAPAWPAFIESCGALKRQAKWKPVCDAAAQMTPATDGAAREFFQQWLVPYQLATADGVDSGLITGYYEPLLRGSRVRSERYRFPLYGTPDDLLTIDLASVYPDLKNLRLRGRLVGNKVVPYYNRAEIEAGQAPLAGKELVWVDDAVELFFLQVQGAGRIELDSGETLRVGYADQNGHPYTSIGRKLVERGELNLDQASMQGIQAWGKRHPEKLTALLDSNASYVFFRELPPGNGGPPGALGVPLTGGRSIAVDPRAVPLGAPVFLSTTYPNSTQPLDRLVLAQDTGGAIKGVVRADFFWGFGEDAAKLAGAMRQQGRMWVLLPKGQ